MAIVRKVKEKMEKIIERRAEKKLSIFSVVRFKREDKAKLEDTSLLGSTRFYLVDYNGKRKKDQDIK